MDEREKKSKPVYVGNERGEPIPDKSISFCGIVLVLITLSTVCLIVIWSVTR